MEAVVASASPVLALAAFFALTVLRILLACFTFLAIVPAIFKLAVAGNAVTTTALIAPVPIFPLALLTEAFTTAFVGLCSRLGNLLMTLPRADLTLYEIRMITPFAR